MLALAEYRRGFCPCGCGGRARETLDPANDGKYQVTDANAIRCHRRTALLIAAERYEKSPQHHALMFIPDLKS